MFRLPGVKRLGFAISTLGGGVAFLTLNERRNVAAMKLRAIAELMAVSLEETDVVNVDKSIDGKLVHYQGFLRPDEQPADHMFGVTNKQLVAIRRRVEMYQWMESSHTVTNKDKAQETVYSYQKVWSTSHLEVKGDMDKRNPPFPSGLPGGLLTIFGSKVHLGSVDKLLLTEDLLAQLTDFKPLALSRDFIRQDSDPFPYNLMLNRTRSALINGQSYFSDNIGDLRVSYEGLFSGPYSSLAKVQFGEGDTRFLQPWLASLERTLASAGEIKFPKDLNAVLGFELDSFVIPEAAIAWAESLLLMLAPLRIAYLAPGRQNLKACIQGVELQDLETLNSLRWIGGGIVFLGVCCFVPSAVLAELPGLGAAAVAAATISWKTIETAKPKINPNASTKGDILI